MSQVGCRPLLDRLFSVVVLCDTAHREWVQLCFRPRSRTRNPGFHECSHLSIDLRLYEVTFGRVEFMGHMWPYGGTWVWVLTLTGCLIHVKTWCTGKRKQGDTEDATVPSSPSILRLSLKFTTTTTWEQAILPLSIIGQTKTGCPFTRSVVNTYCVLGTVLRSTMTAALPLCLHIKPHSWHGDLRSLYFLE